jgi:hypothetical protein
MFTTQTATGFFNYGAPVLGAPTLLEMPADPRVALGGRRLWYDRAGYTSHGPTIGGALVRVEGTNLGSLTQPAKVVLTLDGQQVPSDNVVARNHSVLLLRTPKGVGINRPLVISVDDQASAPTLFTYDPPKVRLWALLWVAGCDLMSAAVLCGARVGLGGWQRGLSRVRSWARLECVGLVQARAVASCCSGCVCVCMRTAQHRVAHRACWPTPSLPHTHSNTLTLRPHADLPL